MTEAAIFAAIDGGDVERVRELVAAEPDVLRARDAEQATPVLRAQYRGQAEVVEELRRTGAALDVWKAAAVGDAARVRELVDADPSLVDSFAPDGFHPLALGAFFGQLVRLLLAHGAAAHKRNAEGRTARDFADGDEAVLAALAD